MTYIPPHIKNPGTRTRLPGGQPTYAGKACKKCLTTTRQVSDNRCVSCLKDRTIQGNIKRREQNFMQAHGVSYAQRDQMFIDQQGKCKICSREGHVDFVPKGDRMFDRLVVDHCHTTGKVRGLLCNGCNRGLGYFKDNPVFLLAAAQYLKASVQ